MYYNTTSNLVDVCTCAGGSCPATGTYSWAPLVTGSSSALSGTTAAGRHLNTTEQATTFGSQVWNWSGLVTGTALTLADTDASATTATTLAVTSLATSGRAGYFTNTGGGYALITGTGNVGIGTTTPPSPLSVGTALTGLVFGAGTSDGAQINETSTATSGLRNGLGVIVQPAPASNSSASTAGMTAELDIPSASTVNYTGLNASTSGVIGNFGSGTVGSMVALYGYAKNASATATVTNMWGAQLNALNASTGTITTVKGLSSVVTNSSTGTLATTAYGVYDSLANGTGTTTTWYGLYMPAVTGNAPGTDYGLYIADTGNNYFAGNVGIGMTSPGYPLDVESSTAVRSIYAVNSYSSTGYAVYGNATGSGGTGVYGSGASYGVYGTAASGIGVYGISSSGTGISANGGTTAVYGYSSGGIGGQFQTSTGYALLTSGGNVGIGTTAPGAPLEVRTTSAGYASNAGGLALTTAGSTSGLRFGVDDSNYSWISSFNSLPLYIDAGGNNTILNATAGNVGIGTTSPTNTLSVGPYGNAGQTTAPIQARNQGNSIEWGHNNQAGFASTLGAQAGSGQAFLCFSCEAGTTSNTFKTRGLMGSLFEDDNAGGFIFETVPTASADNQTATNLVSILTSGNVGIGTTAPGYSLDIQAPIGTARVKSTTGTNLSYLNFNNTGGNLWVGLDQSTGGGLTGGSSAYAGVINVVGAYPLQFGTNNTVAMTILSGGNVGIGTTSPTQALDVDGTNTAYIVVRSPSDAWGATYFGLFQSTGDLPGYPSNVYSILYTDGTDIGFAVGSSYGGYVTSAGFTNVSSRAKKENYEDVDNQLILDKMERLPVMKWNYKTDKDKSIKHIGPFAEDFHEAFGLNGSDVSGITDTDRGGIALAAIKGLIARGEKLKYLFDGDHDALAKLTAANNNEVAEIKLLKAANAALKAANDNEAAQIKALTARLAALEAAHH